jgi:hypothetical protein
VTCTLLAVAPAEEAAAGDAAEDIGATGEADAADVLDAAAGAVDDGVEPLQAVSANIARIASGARNLVRYPRRC